MGIVLVMMLYSVGMCLLIRRVGHRSVGRRYGECDPPRPTPAVVIPDRVPVEWVDSYRSEHDP